MRSQKGHKYWRQLLTAMKFCKNCNICISWKPTSFKCDQILVNFNGEIFGQKSGKSWLILVFSSWRPRFEKFWNLIFLMYFYHQNVSYVKIWVKMMQISWFYSIFLFQRFLLEDFYSLCNAPTQNGPKFWTQPPRSMKFCKNVPYMYMLKVKKFLSVCIFAPWQCWIIYRGWCKFSIPLSGIGLSWWF